MFHLCLSRMSTLASAQRYERNTEQARVQGYKISLRRVNPCLLSVSDLLLSAKPLPRRKDVSIE